MSQNTLDTIILVSITLTISIGLTLLLRRILNVFIQRYADKLMTDPTNFSFLKNSVGFLIYSAAIIFIFFIRSPI